MCVAAAIAGAAILGAGATVYASDQASSAQQNAAGQATATQTGMYNQTRADQAPWRQSGGQALNALDAYYGLPGVSNSADSGQPGGYTPTAGDRKGPGGGTPGQQAGPSQQPVDYNKLISGLPGYQFQFDQGNQALQRNLAARGLASSGAGVKSAIQYGQGYAQNATQDYLNGLRNLAGLGQVSTQATGAAGTNAANQIGANQIYGGNAAASGYANMGNAINGGIGNLAGAYGYYRQQPDPYAGGGQGWSPGQYQMPNDPLTSNYGSGVNPWGP